MWTGKQNKTRSRTYLSPIYSLPKHQATESPPSSLLGRRIYIWSAKDQFHPAGPTLQDTEVTASQGGIRIQVAIVSETSRHTWRIAIQVRTVAFRDI